MDQNGEQATLIVGQVYVADKYNNVTDADVIASQVDDNNVAFGTTNAEGLFITQFVSPGTYDLEVEGYFLDENIQVDVVTGQASPFVELAVRRGGTISGSVTAISGSPLEGASLTAINMDGEAFFANTNDSGEFEILGLPEGTYDVSCEMEQYAPAEQANISVTLGQTTSNVDSELELGVTVSGLVTDSVSSDPIEGADVTVIIDANMFFGTITDVTGYYVVEDLPSGGLILEADHQTHLSSGEIVTIVSPGDSVVQDIVLTPGTSIIGQITDASSGQPIVEATVYIFDGNDLAGVGKTNDIGSATISGLASSTYTAVGSASGYARSWATGLNTSSGSAQFDIQLMIESTIAGTVFIPGSGEPNSLNVFASRQGTLTFSNFAAETMGNSFILSGLPSGTYDIVIIGEGLIKSMDGIVLGEEDNLDLGNITLENGRLTMGNLLDSEFGLAILDPILEIKLESTEAYLRQNLLSLIKAKFGFSTYCLWYKFLNTSSANPSKRLSFSRHSQIAKGRFGVPVACSPFWSMCYESISHALSLS